MKFPHRSCCDEFIHTPFQGRIYHLTHKILESPLDCKEIKPINPKRKSRLNIHWLDWGWSWSSNTLAIWCEELTDLKRPWCWERLKAGEEGDDRGWDGWVASSTQWTWVWVWAKWHHFLIVKDREAWHTAVHEAAKSQTRLSNWTTEYRKETQVTRYLGKLYQLGGPALWDFLRIMESCDISTWSLPHFRYIYKSHTLPQSLTLTSIASIISHFSHYIFQTVFKFFFVFLK